MALYSNGSPQPASAANSTPKTVNGRGLHRRRLNRAQRANLGVDVLVEAVLFKPSIEQVALIFNVPRHELGRRLKLRHEFAAKHPELVRGNPRFGNGRSNGHTETLADHIGRCSPAEWLEAGRKVGPAVIWDTMISPVLAEEVAASETHTTA